MYTHGPDIDEYKEDEIHQFVKREQKRVDVIGNALEEAVDGMEGVACEGRGYLPEVMGLVDVAVDAGMVQPAVDPVDGKIGEE